MKNNKIYLTDNQMNILLISLMSLTRDDMAFQYALTQGIFEESDIFDYIDTMKTFINDNKGNGFLLHKATDVDDILNTAMDFWGESVIKRFED